MALLLTPSCRRYFCFNQVSHQIYWNDLQSQFFFYLYSFQWMSESRWNLPEIPSGLLKDSFWDSWRLIKATLEESQRISKNPSKDEFDSSCFLCFVLEILWDSFGMLRGILEGIWDLGPDHPPTKSGADWFILKKGILPFQVLLRHWPRRRRRLRRLRRRQLRTTCRTTNRARRAGTSLGHSSWRNHQLNHPKPHS